MPIDKQKVSAAAQKYIQRGAYDKAIRELQKLVEAEPDDVRTLLKIGNLFNRKGDIDQAVKVYLGVAQRYREGGFYQKAVAVLKQIAELQPDRVDVAEALGTLYYAQGLARDALTQYRAVLERYVAANDRAGVGRALGVMVQIDAENPALRVKYAEHLARAENIDAALAQFLIAAEQLRRQLNGAAGPRAANAGEEYAKVAERILYYQPNNTQVLRGLVRVYLDAGMSRRALAKLQALYTHDPRDAGTLELLIEAFTALEQRDKVLGALKELAQAQELTQRNRAAAAQTWQRAAAIAPDDPDVRRALHIDDVPMLDDSALIALDDDDLIAEALSPANPVPAASDVEQELERLLAECDACLGYGLYDRAVEHLDAVMTLRPGHQLARARRAAVAKARGHWPEAALEWRSLTQETWTGDRDEAMGYLHEAIALEGASRQNLDLLRALGVSPASLGLVETSSDTATPRPPARSAGVVSDLDLGLDLALSADDLVAPIGAARIDRPVYATLPPDAFELLPEEEPESSAPAPLPVFEETRDELVFDLDGIDDALSLGSADAARTAPPSDEDDELEGLFDLDEDDIDDLFSEDVLTSSLDIALSDAELPDLFGDGGYFGQPEQPDLSEGELQLLLEDLAEADFYTTQGLFGEAGEMIDDLMDRFGQHPLIVAARTRLSERVAVEA